MSKNNRNTVRMVKVVVNVMQLKYKKKSKIAIVKQSVQQLKQTIHQLIQAFEKDEEGRAINRLDLGKE